MSTYSETKDLVPKITPKDFVSFLKQDLEIIKKDLNKSFGFKKNSVIPADPHYIFNINSQNENILHNLYTKDIHKIKYIIEQIHTLNSDLFMNKNSFDETFFHKFLTISNFEIFKYVFDLVKENYPILFNNNYPKNQIIHVLVLNENIDILKYFFENLKTSNPLLFYAKDLDSCSFLVNLCKIESFENFKYIFDFTQENFPDLLLNTTFDDLYDFYDIVWTKNLDVVKYLFEKTSTLLKKSNNGKSILTKVVDNEDINIVKYVFDIVLPDIKNDSILLEKSTNIIHYLMINENMEVIRYVFDIISKTYSYKLYEIKDKNGDTAIHSLLKTDNKNNIEMIKYIFELFLKKVIFQKRNDGTVLHIFPVKNNKGNTILHEIIFSNLETIQYVFEFYKKNFPEVFELKNYEGNTFLCDFILKTDETIIKYVLDFTKENYPSVVKNSNYINKFLVMKKHLSFLK